MKTSVSTRLIAIGLIGIVGGLWFRHNIYNEQRMGRTAFMATQATKFNQDEAHPPHVIIGMLAGLLMAGSLFGVYELFVVGIGMVVRRRTSIGGT
jgi:hypothetical protein